MSKANNSINRNLLLFDSLIEQSPDLIYFKDRESRFIKINKSLAAMYGLENPDQAAGKSDFDFLTDDEARVSREEEKQVMETEKPLVSEIQRKSFKDGSAVWMLRTKFPLRDNQGQIIGTIGVSRDITKSKQVEEELKRQQKKLESAIRDRYRLGRIVGKSSVMLEVYERILKAAASDANVVIYGETGTGKELVARTIHDQSKRTNKPFVAVNCGAIPPTLFESEFFGHRKGSFTGAYADKRGFFASANGGILFLDEVGELNQELQVKLLRAIEGNGYTPVGSDRVEKADVRIIAATNRDLVDMLGRKLIRPDFFYRLNVVTIAVPPLRERREDIPLLVDHFIQRGDQSGIAASELAKISGRLYNYNWPGNVRELENTIQRYLAIGQLELSSGQSLDPGSGKDSAQNFQEKSINSLRQMAAEFERKTILQVLEEVSWHKSKAANLLGIGRRTLYQKMKTHGLL